MCEYMCVCVCVCVCVCLGENVPRIGKCTATYVVPHDFIMRRTVAGTEIETDRHRKTETETKGCT